MKVNHKYTEHETQLARELLAAGATDEQCRLRMRRSKKALRVHLRWRDNPAARAKDKLRKTTAKGPKIYTCIASRPQPQADQIAAALHRNYAPRSVTSRLLGDPAPGQSALDQRNAREARV